MLLFDITKVPTNTRLRNGHIAECLADFSQKGNIATRGKITSLKRLILNGSIISRLQWFRQHSALLYWQL